MSVFEKLKSDIVAKGALFLVLIDPDSYDEAHLIEFIEICNKNGVDGFLVGGSLMVTGSLTQTLTIIKAHSEFPRLIFPVGVGQVDANANALLYISLISGRNGDQLIGQHVLAAPIIKRTGIEPISTGYMLIDSGAKTTAEYMSNSQPIPRNKPAIAAATGLAAQYMGMKMLYLEAGSGADNSVPDEMVRLVSKMCDIPVIVGGGIRDPQVASAKIQNGAKAIVIGNFFEDSSNWMYVRDFALAIHSNQNVKFI